MSAALVALLHSLLSPPVYSDSSELAGSVMVPLPPGERESWGAISGIVVLVLLVVLLLALLLLYRRRQKDKQNNTPTVSFSTSRTVNSEYAVPGRVAAFFPSGHAERVLRMKYMSQHWLSLSFAIWMLSSCFFLRHKRPHSYKGETRESQTGQNTNL